MAHKNENSLPLRKGKTQEPLALSVSMREFQTAHLRSDVEVETKLPSVRGCILRPLMLCSCLFASRKPPRRACAV